MSEVEHKKSAVRVGLVFDHLFPFAHGGAERVYRVLADALAAEGTELTYFTRSQWVKGQDLHTSFNVQAVWSGELYDVRGSRLVGPALRWSVSLLQALWHADLDMLVLSATPVFNVFVGLIAKLRQPKIILVVDWLEIWPLRKWQSYSGVVSGTLAWWLQSIATSIGSVRLVNSKVTLNRLRNQTKAKVIQLPLASMAGPPVSRAAKHAGGEILFVGRHIPDKNLTILPSVIASLIGEFPRLHATVVGDGPDRIIAEQRATELGVASRFDFVGRVEDEELEQLLSSSSLLFFPSIREGFGLVVCEAARYGTPSIVVDHPDNAAVTLIAEGVNGAIAGTLTVDELVNATRRVLQAGEILQRRTQEWYDDAWNGGGFDQVARELVELARSQRSTSQ